MQMSYIKHKILHKKTHFINESPTMSNIFNSSNPQLIRLTLPEAKYY